jgi:uncharacterized membrane protein
VTCVKSRFSNRLFEETRVPLILVWLLILAFVLTFATLSLRRHAALATNGLDLGNVDQALWNTAHGDFLAFTNMSPVRNRLALHVEPILLLFVPFYWIGLGGPELLLAVQAAVVGLGALPVYWLTRDALVGPKQHEAPRPAGASRDGENRGTGSTGSLLPTGYSLIPVVFPLAYLLIPALEGAVMYDFHAVTIAPTFLLFAFYYLEKRSNWPFVIFSALAVFCKEDMGLTVAMLGLYAMVAWRRWSWGGTTFVAGVAWFAIMVFLVQPYFSPIGSNIQAGRYAWLGETPLAVLSTLLNRTSLVWDHVWRQANPPGYLVGLLLPTAFLSVLSPLAWLPALPSFAVNLLSDNPFTWRLEDFHYAAPIVPFVLIAAIYGIRRLVYLVEKRSQTASRWVLIAACSILLVASLGYHQARGFSPLARPFQPWLITEHHRRARAVFAQVPADAAVFAQDNLNPQVSSRRVLYQGPILLTDPSRLEGLPTPEYLLFDVSSLVNQDDFHRFIISELMGERGFGPVVADDGYLLLERGAPAEQPSDEFYNFVRAAPDQIAYSLAADFGDVLRLHGFDLLFNRAEEVQVVLYLEALSQLDEDYFLSLYLIDQWGSPVGATVHDQPATVWYPTHRWQPGELVKVTFNTIPWYSRDISAYRLAVGVMRGHDPWQSPARLIPASLSEDDTAYAVRLLDGGTLLELARFRQVWGMPLGGPVERELRRPRVRTAVDVSLGGEIRLLGYDADSECGVSAGNGADDCWLGLVLYWEAEQKMSSDYTVFVHLVGPDGHIWAQHDTPPDSGAYPTSRWVKGEVVADPIRVPYSRDLPASSEVMVGIYHPGTGQRLPTLDAQGQPIDDKVVLGRSALK